MEYYTNPKWPDVTEIIETLLIAIKVIGFFEEWSF